MAKRRICFIVGMTGSILAACASPNTTELQAPFAKARDDGALSCRGMKDLSFIPAGYHPVTARWEPDSPFGDTVCIAKTSGDRISLLSWMGFQLPPGYHTISSITSGVDTTFRGCAQYSVWQGRKTCMTSWSKFQMQKDRD